MKMNLSVFERVTALQILPTEGDFLTLKIMRNLREQLSFSEQEHAALQFRRNGDAIMWQAEADKPKQIELGEKAKEIVAGQLKALDTSKKLKNEHYSLYEKFVGEE